MLLVRLVARKSGTRKLLSANWEMPFECVLLFGRWPSLIQGVPLLRGDGMNVCAHSRINHAQCPASHSSAHRHLSLGQHRPRHLVGGRSKTAENTAVDKRVCFAKQIHFVCYLVWHVACTISWISLASHKLPKEQTGGFSLREPQ